MRKNEKVNASLLFTNILSLRGSFVDNYQFCLKILKTVVRRIAFYPLVALAFCDMAPFAAMSLLIPFTPSAISPMRSVLLAVL